MQTRTWTSIDKSAWGPGAWQDEPDRIQFPDPPTGLPCQMVRHHKLGHWCGFVGLPDWHPWHGIQHHLVEADVHGGLSFGGFAELAKGSGRGLW